MNRQASGNGQHDAQKLHSRSRRLLLAVVVAIPLLGLAACGDSDEPSSPGSSSTAEPDGANGEPDPTADSQPADGDRIVYGVDLSTLELPNAQPYDDYQLLEDDTQQVEVSVPSVWDDVDTRTATRTGAVEIPGIWASTDLEAFEGGYSVPGVQVDLRVASGADSILQQLDSDNSTDAACVEMEAFEYDDGRYQGTAELWTDCGEPGAALLQVVVFRAGNQYISTEIQMLNDADIDAAVQILESFTAVDIDPGEEWAFGTGKATYPMGEQFTIFVPSNPSVEDDWRLVPTHDEGIVRFLFEDWEPADPTGREAGAGGTSYFTFEAVGAGTTTITIENCRGCPEGGGEPVDSTALEATVQP